MIITENREKFTNSDPLLVDLLVVSTIDPKSSQYQIGNTIYDAPLPSLEFTFTKPNNVLFNAIGVQVKEQIIGRLTGNFNNNIYEVRLFCPVWCPDGTPQYYVKVNLNYTPVQFKFMTDEDARKIPRSVFRDYHSRDGFFSFFPHVAIEMKSMSYNQNFTKIGHWNDIMAYFGNKDWNLEYSETTRSAISGNLGQQTPYFTDNYDPIQKDNIFRTDYFNVDVRKTSLLVNFRASWGGKYLKQNVGVLYSSTNTEPRLGGENCETFISKKDHEPFVFDWNYSGSGTVPLNKIPATPNTTYYLRPFMVFEDDTFILGPIKTVTTPSVGLKPKLQPIRMKLTDKSVDYDVQVVDIGDSEIVAHGIRVGTTPTNMVDKVIDNANWKPLLNFYSFSLYLQDLIPNKKYYFQAYATNADGETVNSDYYEDVIIEPGFVTPVLNNSGFFRTKSDAVKPEVGLSLAKNITKDTAYIEGFIWGNGGRVITEFGFVTSKKTNKPTLENYDIIEPVIANITSSYEMIAYNMIGLAEGTEYWVSFYAKNSVGISYSDATNFKTISSIKVQTKNIYNITPTGAISGGNVTGESEIITERGVCWSVLPEPTISDNIKPSGKDVGSFDAAISELNPLTRYYVRSYATTTNGTSYGEQTQFDTIADVEIETPKAATLPPEIGDTFIISGVSILTEGTQGVVNKGIVISSISNPTNLDDVIFNKTGDTDSPIRIDGLEKDTNYYVIGYAENEIAFYFGEAIPIKTIADLEPQTFEVDVDLTYSFYIKDVNGKTINKVTSTITTIETNIKEYKLYWTTEILKSIDPSKNILMNIKTSTQSVIDVFDMPCNVPIYYFASCVNSDNVECRSVETKQITLPEQGGVTTPTTTTTSGLFSPPNNADIGTIYQFKNKEWIKTGEGWEKNKTNSATTSTVAPLIPVSGKRSVQVSQNTDLIEPYETKKMVAIDTDLGLKNTRHYLRLYFNEDVKFETDETVVVTVNNVNYTNFSGVDLFQSDKRVIGLMSLTSGANSDFQAIHSVGENITVTSINNVNRQRIIPKDDRKFRLKDSHEVWSGNNNGNEIQLSDETVVMVDYNTTLQLPFASQYDKHIYEIKSTNELIGDGVISIKTKPNEYIDYKYNQDSHLRLSPMETVKLISVGNQWWILSNESKPLCRKYVATLNQANTGDTVDTVFENTLCGNDNITWTRLEVGKYKGVLTNVFNGNIIFTQEKQIYWDQNDTPCYMCVTKINNSEILLETFQIISGMSDTQLRDDALNNTLIEIRVYN